MCEENNIKLNFELCCLFNNLKKSIELWFLIGNREKISLDPILEILRHKLKLEKAYENEIEVKTKVSNDFEWLRRSAQIRDTLISYPNPPNSVVATEKTIEKFLSKWISQNLQINCLCPCLQNLIAETELLEYYYDDNAFMRNEKYRTGFLICLSALELNQYSLLSQIDLNLLHPKECALSNKHKRCSSHPRFSITTPTKNINTQKQMKNSEEECSEVVHQRLNSGRSLLQTFRKVKSFPDIRIMDAGQTTTTNKNTRPRSKTINNTSRISNANKTNNVVSPTHPIKMPIVSSRKSNPTYIANIVQPSSINSPKSHYSDSTVNSFSSTASSSSLSASPKSNNSSTVNAHPSTRPIELIKCDDIKIWTDQSCWETQEVPIETPVQPTTACLIPRNECVCDQTKSFSPINSFLSSLFGTPPTYTSWSIINQNSSTCKDIEEATETEAFPCNFSKTEKISTSVFESFLPIYGKKLKTNKTKNLFEDGISTLDYSCSSNSSKENAEQHDTTKTISGKNQNRKNSLTLTGFLQMSQNSRNNTELEKENAHFRISEAVISAIEHMKWSKSESDNQNVKTSIATDWLENDHKKINPQSSALVATEEHIAFAEVTENYTDLDSLSAEVVGLSLISKFNDKHLPKVSELKWLVSEDDAPQKLLPLPNDNAVTSITRGTRFWAPPRPQIIFTEHPTLNLKEHLKKQNYRCAGCGMKVSTQNAHSFRYCTYLGKYNCTGCHRNQISAIPAKILQSWNFKCFPVSVFAYRLIEQMYHYPLFYVPDLNPALYVREKVLLNARFKRVQLKFVKDFIKLCRFAKEEQIYFDAIPTHITAEPDIWSMSDFIDARNKSLHRSIDELIYKCENHIFHCVLCTARGFFCEFCRKNEIIYPWSVHVYRCERCGACFHQNCWKSVLELCCRCQRIHQRKDDFINL